MIHAVYIMYKYPTHMHSCLWVHNMHALHMFVGTHVCMCMHVLVYGNPPPGIAWRADAVKNGTA